MLFSRICASYAILHCALKILKIIFGKVVLICCKTYPLGLIILLTSQNSLSSIWLVFCWFCGFYWSRFCPASTAEITKEIKGNKHNKSSWKAEKEEVNFPLEFSCSTAGFLFLMFVCVTKYNNSRFQSSLGLFHSGSKGGKGREEPSLVVNSQYINGYMSFLSNNYIYFPFVYSIFMATHLKQWL